MNKELIELLTERAALLAFRNGTGVDSDIVETDVVVPVAFETGEDERLSPETESIIEVFEFDLDMDYVTNLDRYMALQFIWNDWNAQYFEIF